MAINFPASPSTNDTHTEGNNRWVWNGSSWTKLSSNAVTDYVLLSDESADTTCFPIFATSATGSNTPKTGSNLTFNSNTGVLTSDGFNVADSKKVQVGSSQDLSIYHSGSHSYIKHNGTGNLYTDIGVGDQYSITVAESTHCADFVAGGSVILRHNGNEKIKTTADGIEVTGKIFPSSHIDMADNVKLLIGTGDDLELYHSGSHSYIKDAGTGALIINGNEVLIKNAADNEDILKCTQDAGVELYYNNVKKFATNSDGVDLGDNVKLRIGDAPDYKIYHNGSNTYHENYTGDLFIKSDQMYLASWTGGENYLHAVKDGRVALYYDNATKLATTNTGVSVTGDLVTSGNIDLADSSGGSNNRIKLGTGDDLQVYHDGSNGYVYNSGSGNLTLVGNGSNKIQIRAKNGENSITCNSDGSVELYHDSSKKFETTTTGAKATGKLEVTGNLEVGGVLTYEDVTNIDSVGIITARDHLVVNADNKRLKIGAGADLNLYHDGNNSVIDNDTGSLYINSASEIYLCPNNTEAGVYVRQNGAVQLYHDNTLKFETVSYGVVSKGSVEIQSGSMTTADSSNSGVTNSAIFGTGSDLKIYHDGSNSIIHESGPGSLIIASNGPGIWLQKNVSSSENLAVFRTDGACELNYDAVKKFETTSWGVNVTGIVQCDEFKLLDNEHAKFGTGEDLRIYHQSSDESAVIKNNNDTGWLRLLSGDSNSSGILLKNRDDDVTYLRAKNEQGVELFYGNSVKFETTSYGAEVKGYIQADGSSGYGFTGGDNVKLSLGASNDLQLWHDGSNSYIKDNGTGELRFISNTYKFYNAAFSETLLQAFENGAVELFYNNTKRFETKNDGAKVTGHLQLDNSSGTDTAIYTTNAAGIKYQADENGHTFQTYVSGWLTRLKIHDAGTTEATLQGNILSQTSPVLVLRSSTNTNMRTNFLMQDDYPSGRGSLAINVTEVGATNDRDLLLQRSGGRVGVNCNPNRQFEIGGHANAEMQISPNDGNAGESRIFIGGNSTDQNKCAIIHDPAGGYCRGNLHFCLEGSGDTSNVDSSDSKAVIMSSGDFGIATTSPQSKLHVQSGSLASGTIMCGGNYNAGGLSNNAAKAGAIHAPHYNSDTYPKGFRAYGTYSDNNINLVQIGGGTNDARSATQVRLYTATSSTANGTERFRLNSSGAVSIASNNYASGNANAKLRVGTESGSTNAVVVFGSGDTTVPALAITNWDGATASNRSVIHFDNSGHGGFEIGCIGGVDAFGVYEDGTERIRLNNSGDIILQGGKIYGEDNASNTFTLQSTSGNSNHSRIEIGAIQSSDNGGIHFYTAGSSTATRFMTLKGTSGNLGLGVDNPACELHIHKGTRPQINLFATQHAQNNGANLNFGVGVNASVSGNTGARIEMNIPNSGGQMTGDLILHTNSGDNLYECMRIQGTTGWTVFKGSGTEVTIKPTDGLINFGMDGRSSFVTGENSCYIFSGSGASGDMPAGTLVLQSRSNVNRHILFATGTTPTERMNVRSDGQIRVPNQRFTIDRGTSNPGGAVLYFSGSKSTTNSAFDMFRINTVHGNTTLKIELTFHHSGGGVHGSYMRKYYSLNSYNGLSQRDTATANFGGGGGFTISRASSPNNNYVTVRYNGSSSFHQNFVLSGRIEHGQNGGAADDLYLSNSGLDALTQAINY